MNSLGYHSVVFDTGKRDVGGRCSSRKLILAGTSNAIILDHSAQFFSTYSDDFEEEVEKMLSEQVIRNWDGKLVRINSAGVAGEVNSPKYAGFEGMASVSQY